MFHIVFCSFMKTLNLLLKGGMGAHVFGKCAVTIVHQKFRQAIASSECIEMKMDHSTAAVTSRTPVTFPWVDTRSPITVQQASAITYEVCFVLFWFFFLFTFNHNPYNLFTHLFMYFAISVVSTQSFLWKLTDLGLLCLHL